VRTAYNCRAYPDPAQQQVTFTLDTDAPDPLPQTSRAVGVDLGVTDFAVTSEGDKIANPGLPGRCLRS
jgi:transposase